MKFRELLPESWGLLYAAFAFSQGIGLLAYWALPLVAGALISGLGLSTTQAGLVGTVEFCGLFLSSLVLAKYVDRTSRRMVALVSVVIVVLVNLLCGLVDLGYGPMIVLRFVSGLGAGLALAVGNATIANARDPERFSGHLTVALVAFMVVIMPVLSRFSESFGFQGVFLGLAGTVVIGGLSIFFLPDGPDSELKDTKSKGGLVTVSLLGGLTLAVLAVAFLFGARGTLPWLVAEQLGTDAGYSVAAMGDLFSIMYAVSILGPAALLLLARVVGPRTILLYSLTLAGFFAWMFTVSAGNAAQFSIGIVVWATIYFLAFAQLNAVAAMIDRDGRIASAAGSAFIAGVTVAPILGGIIVDSGGYAYLGVAILALTVIIALFVFLRVPVLTEQSHDAKSIA